VHRYATGRTADHNRLRGLVLWRLGRTGVDLPDHEADGRERDSAARMEQAEVADFHNAFGQHVLKEPAEKLRDVEVGGAGACPAHFPGGEGDGTVLEADDAVVGDSDPEDIGGQGGEGGVAVVLCLTVAISGEGPHLGIDVLQQSGGMHGVLAECTIDG